MNRTVVTGLLAVLFVISLIANVFEYYRYSTSRPLVTVGNQVIRKKDYQDALDYQAGKSVLTKMVYSDLVMQAAAKNGVTPSDAEVDSRLADIRRRTPQMLTEADQDPLKMADLKRNLKTDIALENLRIQNVPASDAEVAAFYQTHKSLFTLPTQVQTTLVVTQSPLDADTAKTMLQQGIKPDVIARQPRLRVNGIGGFQVNMDALPPAQRAMLGRAILGMKSGEIKTVSLGKYILVFQSKNSEEASVQPFAVVKDQATRVVKLQKAPSALVEIAKLYRETKPKFNIDKYESFFSDVEKFNTQQNTAAAH